MFRLIKLAFYGLAGYAIYEFWRGISAGSTSQASRGESDVERAADSEGGRMGTLTGEGIGQPQRTLDSTGGSSTQFVGRGVTSS